VAKSVGKSATTEAPTVLLVWGARELTRAAAAAPAALVVEAWAAVAVRPGAAGLNSDTAKAAEEATDWTVQAVRGSNSSNQGRHRLPLLGAARRRFRIRRSKPSTICSLGRNPGLNAYTGRLRCIRPGQPDRSFARRGGGRLLGHLLRAGIEVGQGPVQGRVGRFAAPDCTQAGKEPLSRGCASRVPRDLRASGHPDSIKARSFRRLVRGAVKTGERTLGGTPG
jgi:hypothetical protein